MLRTETMTHDPETGDGLSRPVTIYVHAHDFSTGVAQADLIVAWTHREAGEIGCVSKTDARLLQL